MTSTPETHEYWKVVLRHRESFLAHPALQEVYRHFASRMRRHLSRVPGRNVELGCGCGALSGYMPGFTRTDLHKHDWVDEVVDACRMPYAEESCANLVAVDMLHHLPDVTSFFDEVLRVLAVGGRLVLLEPKISPFSYLVYRFLHHEPVDVGAEPFGAVRTVDPDSGEPCNAALPTLVFERSADEFRRRWPGFRIVALERYDSVVYPATGGFSRATPFPARLVVPLLRMEDAVVRVTGRLTALRLLVVVEKGES